jgi:putative redox protein
LAAVLELPNNGEARGYALFAHCFTCTKDIFSARYLTAGLCDNGFAVLRFDFSGQGASEGDFENTNFSSNVEDLLHAAAFLRDNYQAPVLLLGHSLGGAAVLAAAGDIPEVRAVATVGAPAEPAHVQHLFTDSVADIQRDGVAEVLLAGRPFRIKRQFLEDIEGVRLADRIRRMNRALIIFHSIADKTVDIENARQIYEAARHPKSFVSLDRADHLLSDKRDAQYVSGVLSAWASRYLGEEAMQPPPDSATDDNQVVVRNVGDSLTHKAHNGKHEIIIDEPESVGGADRGPTPYGYLKAALAACTAITLRMYAKRKKFSLRDIVVSVSHEKIEDGNGGKTDRFNRVIQLDERLGEAEREKLLNIANKCPVHKTLEATAHIDTALGATDPS